MDMERPGGSCETQKVLQSETKGCGRTGTRSHRLFYQTRGEIQVSSQRLQSRTFSRF